MITQVPVQLPVSFWFACTILTILYIVFLIWFSKDRRFLSPTPDSSFIHQEKLDRLTQDVSHLIVDELSIETGDEPLGKGVDGFVFKGYALPNSRGRFKRKVPVAVKVSVPIPSSAVRLLEEASRLSRLSRHEHPHIVTILAVTGLPSRPVLALEWLPGGSLQNYFRNFIRAVEDEHDRPVILLRDILDVIYQVTTAVKQIHETLDSYGREIVHGDIAARNVLLYRKDLTRARVKLGDFGLPEGARPLAWLPPEIILAHHGTPRQTMEGDIWMLGVFMWECLTIGATPHYQRSLEEIQRCLRLPDRGLACPSGCPLDVWTAVLESLSEAHRRPRCAGDDTDNHSLVYRMRTLREQYSSSTHRVYPKENLSNCTCPEHRCKGTASMLVD